MIGIMMNIKNVHRDTEIRLTNTLLQFKFLLWIYV